jgi:hypothetical protein
MIRTTVMVGKGPDLVDYDEYIAYIDSGETAGTMSHDEWLLWRTNRTQQTAPKK